MTTTRSLGPAGAVLCLLLAALPAWAVTGTFTATVKGPGDAALENVTVKLVPDDPNLTEQQKRDQTIEAKTDSSGTVTTTVEEGNYSAEVDGRVTPVTIRPNQTTRLDIFLAMPFMSQNPGGRFGNFTLGPVGLLQWSDLDIQDETETVTIDTGTGQSVTVFKNLSPNNFRMRMNAGVAEVVGALPGFSAFGWGFSPAISGVLGGASVKLENTATDFKLTGTGIVYGGGIELAAVPTTLPRFHVAAGFQGWWMNADDLRGRVNGQDICSQFVVQSCRFKADVESQVIDVYARAGYSIFDDHVAPFLGFKLRWTDADSVSDLRLAVPGATLRDKVEIDFKRDAPSPAPMGIAGVDFRGPDLGILGRVFGRVQAQFDGAGVDVLFKVMYMGGVR
jgi:hypothetical protein